MTSNFPQFSSSISVSISVVNTEVSETSSWVSGYHNDKDIWDAVIGTELQCEREPDTNRSD